jgi:hypothetical protein
MRSRSAFRGASRWPIFDPGAVALAAVALSQKALAFNSVNTAMTARR